MKIYIEVDTKKKSLKKRIYTFRPDNVDVVEVDINDGEVFKYEDYIVKGERGAYKLVRKKK